MYGYERPRHDNPSADIALLLAIVIVAPGDAHTFTIILNPHYQQKISVSLPPSLSVIADVW